MPAWAVNQLYWRERDAYDRLVEASDALRVEHRKHLSGKPADIRPAEKAYRDAVKAATETIRRLLSESGEAASAATMAAVTETLESLPAAEPPGRLVRPLKPQGFEALAGLGARPVSAPPPPSKRDGEADTTSGPRAAAAKKREEAERRAAEAAERAAEEQRERERAARAQALQDAEAAIEKARAALDDAHREVERRSDELAAAREALRQLKRAT